MRIFVYMWIDRTNEYVECVLVWFQVKCPLPMTPGHEGVGTVVKLGESVNNVNSTLQIGDRVTVPWLHSSCGQCEHCWSGWETVCSQQKRTGI